MARDLFKERDMEKTSKTGDQIALIKALGPLGLRLIKMLLDFFSGKRKKEEKAKKEAKRAKAYAPPKDMDNLDA